MAETYQIAVIRVVTLENEEKLQLHGKLINEYFPNLITTSYCIPDQYEGVHDDLTYERATKKIVDLAKSIQHKYDGIVISCAGDPGVEILRKELEIPVVGAGHSVASFSLNFGERIGVLGITADAPQLVASTLGDKLIKAVKPEGVNTTNDLLTEVGRAAVVQTAGELQQEGVDAILLACTGMSTIGIAKFLQEKLNIPVIDPVYSEALVINGLCKYRSAL